MLRGGASDVRKFFKLFISLQYIVYTGFRGFWVGAREQWSTFLHWGNQKFSIFQTRKCSKKC